MTLRSPRDLRIDLLRGIALVMVFVNHAEDASGAACLSRWTLRNWGPSDAAELFILLSGLAVGRSCSARLERERFSATLRHAWRRTFTLYLGLIFTAATMYGLARGLGVQHVSQLAASGQPVGTWPQVLWWFATLRGAPPVLQILGVYLCVLPLAPYVVAWLKRSFWPPLIVSAVVYTAVQWLWWRASRRPEPSGNGWYFQPGGWQLLYCLGLAAGVAWQRSAGNADASEGSRPRIRTYFISICAAAVMIAGWWLRPEWTAASESWLHELQHAISNVWIRLVNKPTLGPLRLLHALAAAYLLWRLLPERWSFHLPLSLVPVAACGQRSLVVYCAGSVLTVVAAGGAARWGTDPLSILLLNLNCLLVLLLIGSWPRRSAATDQDSVRQAQFERRA